MNTNAEPTAADQSLSDDFDYLTTKRQTLVAELLEIKSPIRDKALQTRANGLRRAIRLVDRFLKDIEARRRQEADLQALKARIVQELRALEAEVVRRFSSRSGESFL